MLHLRPLVDDFMTLVTCHYYIATKSHEHTYFEGKEKVLRLPFQFIYKKKKTRNLTKRPLGKKCSLKSYHKIIEKLRTNHE